MSKFYTLDVSDVKSERRIAYVCGGLDLISYAARGARSVMDSAEDGTEYSVTLVETDTLAGDEVRSLASFTGDAEIASLVLGKRLRTERASENVPEDGSEAPAPRTRRPRKATAPAAEATA